MLARFSNLTFYEQINIARRDNKNKNSIPKAYPENAHETAI